MEFRKILTLRGPNIWANFPALEAWVDLLMAFAERQGVTDAAITTEAR